MSISKQDNDHNMFKSINCRKCGKLLSETMQETYKIASDDP